VVKTSTDGGLSWGPTVRLTQSNQTHFYSDGTILVDPATQRVWVMYSLCIVATGYRDCRDRWAASDDHGVSWTQLPSLDRYSSSGVGGVGSGIVLQRGSHKGRLLFTKAHAMTSDDHGATWQSGPPIAGNEAQIAEMRDGTLVAAARSGYSPRLFFSQDGGSSWSAGYQLDGTNGHANITTDNCALSFISTSNGSVVLLSHPNRPDIHQMKPQPIGRQNVTVTAGRYNPATGQPEDWADYITVYTGPSAYTSLAQLSGRTCGVLYERSPTGTLPVHFTSIHLAAFPCQPAA